MKKQWFLWILFLSVQIASFAQAYTLGDVNHSGKIDIIDALSIAQY